MKAWFLIVITLTLPACKPGSETTSPTVETISESVYASGIVKSKNQYEVFSTVNGLIQEILVTEGDTVRKGDPLLRVRDESSKFNTSNARLAADNADLYANTDKISEARVAQEVAQGNMKNDSLMLMRQRNLWSQQIGSLNEFEQKELAYKNSLAEYRVARLRYSELQRQLVFASKQSKNNLRISTLQAGDYLVKAEASGMVYKILKEQGEFASTMNPLAVVGDAKEFLMEMNVDEYDIARIRMGQKVLFTMDSYKGKVFEATVSKIEPLMNEQSRSFMVKAAFVTRPPVLYPNLSVEANIIIRSKEKAMTIPRSYLVGDSVVNLKNGKVRKVVIGLRDYQKVEIVSGLTTGDLIYKLLP